MWYGYLFFCLCSVVVMWLPGGICEGACEQVYEAYVRLSEYKLW